MENKIYHFYVLKSDLDPEQIRYVGVTSTTINKRFSQHKYCATHPEKCGLPVHKWMSSVYKKGGKIIIEKIDECLEEEWETKEVTLIKMYKDLGFRLLNLDKGGKGVVTKEKRTKSSLERSGEAHRKPVIALTLKGEFFKEFESVTKAAEYFNHKHTTNISSVLNGFTKSAYGYLWVYKECYNPDETKIYSKKQIGLKLYQFDFEGNLIHSYNSKSEAIQSIPCDHKSLDRAIDEKRNFKGFYWSLNDTIDIKEFINPYKYSVEKEGNICYFIEQKQIAEYIEASKSTINQKLKKFPEGFEWNGYFIKILN